MAQRKAPQTSPVNDNSAGDEPIKVIAELSKSHFDNVIRSIRRGSMGRAEAIQDIVKENIDRLGVTVGKTSAVTKTPDGSDQFDTGTFKTWCEKITADDKAAVNQLKKFAATCSLRCE